MLRNRFTQLGLLLLLSAVTTVAVAAPPPGKGGGGGDDSDNGDRPPVTYTMSFIDGFTGANNESGDLIGDAFIGGDSQDAIYYEGNAYLLSELFIGSGASPRFIGDLSERTTSGGLYLCGSCETADGIRGFRLLVEPDGDGQLQRTDLDFASPPVGDDETTLSQINSSGEACGQSRVSSTNVRQAIYLEPDGTTVPFFFGGSPQGITESGLIVFLDRSGIGNPYPAYTRTPSGDISFLLNDVSWVADVNAFGTVIGRQSIVEGSGKESRTIEYEFVLGAQLVQEDAGSYRTFAGLNDFGDVLVRDVLQGSRKNPDRVVGSVIFGDTGLEFSIDEMIDPSTSDSDFQRYLESSISVSDITLTGEIYAAIKPLGASEYNSTIILTPVTTP